jgi:hypothetical protein
VSDPRRLLLIPAATYGLSYLYLALYHGRVDLWFTVVHENGRLSFLETTFYASHFFGHIPVLVTVALLMAATALVFGVTWVANGRSLDALLWVWCDPRYLAHSVRELVTFPLTYYLIPLAVMLWREPPTRSGGQTSLLSTMAVAVTSALFLAGFGYQVVVSLSPDARALAQRSDFAHGGELGVAYLLAAHYFEHVLDTVFFALLTLLLVGAPLKVTRDM